MVGEVPRGLPSFVLPQLEIVQRLWPAAVGIAYVYGEAIGEAMFYGPGAGSLPTATAVVSDLVTVVKNMRLGVNGRSAMTPQFKKSLKGPSEITAKFFIRLHVKDQVGVLAKITNLFAEHGVGFDKILQLPMDKEDSSEIVLVTHIASIAAFEKIKQNLDDYDMVKEIKSTYRVEGIEQQMSWQGLIMDEKVIIEHLQGGEK